MVGSVRKHLSTKHKKKEPGNEETWSVIDREDEVDKLDSDDLNPDGDEVNSKLWQNALSWGDC